MTKITVFLIFLIVLVVGYYSYLSGKSRTEQGGHYVRGGYGTLQRSDQ